MITTKDFMDVLKGQYPDITFFNGCINKHKPCVGVYARGNAIPPVAIGSKSSYGILPVTLLIHWGENSQECEETANRLYEGLENEMAPIGGAREVQLQMLESCPVNIGRDDNNMCEMTIRINIFYERR